MINIDHILKERGITKTQLTNKMGFKSRTALYRVLQGKATLETLEKLSEILNVPVSEILGEVPIIGFIEYKDTIYKINSKDSLKKVVGIIEKK